MMFVLTAYFHNSLNVYIVYFSITRLKCYENVIKVVNWLFCVSS